MKLEELKEHVDKLKALLDDPHPGLMTWNQFLHERMTALTEGWNGGGDLLTALLDARQAIYCYEQNLFSQCREESAKLQTARLKRIDAVIAKARGE